MIYITFTELGNVSEVLSGASLPANAFEITAQDALDMSKHLHGACVYTLDANDTLVVNSTMVDTLQLAGKQIEATTLAVLEYNTLKSEGVTYNGAAFQSDAASITALNEVLTAIANGWGIPANFAWIDSADVPHVADLTFLKGLAIALADHKAALFARLQVAKAALRSATTQAEIEAITL